MKVIKRKLKSIETLEREGLIDGDNYSRWQDTLSDAHFNMDSEYCRRFGDGQYYDFKENMMKHWNEKGFRWQYVIDDGHIREEWFLEEDFLSRSDFEIR